MSIISGNMRLESMESKESVKCASVNGNSGAEVISMCVVPIWVGHKN